MITRCPFSIHPHAPKKKGKSGSFSFLWGPSFSNKTTHNTTPMNSHWAKFCTYRSWPLVLDSSHLTDMITTIINLTFFNMMNPTMRPEKKMSGSMGNK